VAALYTNGTWKSLGTLGGPGSTALAINDSGVVVGASAISGSSNTTHAFIYANGKMTDLNSLLPPSFTGVTLFGATNINNLGQIVAYGGTTLGGAMQDYLLSPPGEAPLAMVTNLPEPSTLTFFSLIVAGLCIRHAKARSRSGSRRIPPSASKSSWSPRTRPGRHPSSWACSTSDARR
jgi:probable HAF family extracellular repeat protein